MIGLAARHANQWKSAWKGHTIITKIHSWIASWGGMVIANHMKLTQRIDKHDRLSHTFLSLKRLDGEGSSIKYLFIGFTFCRWICETLETFPNRKINKWDLQPENNKQISSHKQIDCTHLKDFSGFGDKPNRTNDEINWSIQLDGFLLWKIVINRDF